MRLATLALREQCRLRSMERRVVRPGDGVIPVALGEELAGHDRFFPGFGQISSNDFLLNLIQRKSLR